MVALSSHRPPEPDAATIGKLETSHAA
jgi:hypothetical protein